MEAPSSPFALALIGGGTLVASAFLGKLAVDAVQGEAPKRPGERGDFEESVRLVGSLVGISVTLLQIPNAIAQAKELIQKGDIPALPALTP